MSVVTYAIASNIVKEDNYHKVCVGTLDTLSNALIQSFGPTGSNTAIYKNGIAKYTKDGRSILEDIRFNGVIEESVREDIKEITRNVDLKVGDGTTSAIILASILFKKLIENKDKFKNPYEVIRRLNTISDVVADNIKNRVQEFTPEKAYNIAMVSTNGDEFVSTTIRDIYAKHGNDVFIDVMRSNDANHKIKTIDSLILEDGFSDASFVNDPVNNKVIIPNAHIYIFENQIDTPMMVNLMRAIIFNNITKPLETLASNPEANDVKLIPTVIICPYIARDQASFFDNILTSMNEAPPEYKVPLNVITTPKDQYKLHDIAKLCGCKVIKKYIDPKLYEEDVKLGLAPTVDTIHKFAGHAETVISDNSTTQFLNPVMMYEDKERTKYSSTYTGLLDFIKKEIRLATDQNENIDYIGKMKRRLRTLEANMVELYIGGISSTDRDYHKDLVIDAVKNCRSAAKYGCGYGANIEGLLAIDKIWSATSNDEDFIILTNIIHEAYTELVNKVYRNAPNPSEIVDDILKIGKPYNINTLQVDDNILCSIETDVEIFKSVIKIVSVLFTCNQFIASSCALASPYQTL